MAFWSRRKPAAAPDALAAFDALLEDLDLQGSEVRKSAATLIALRGELTRSVARCDARARELASRLAEAQSRHDAKALTTLQRDEATTQRELQVTEEALARAQADAGLLTEAANRLRTEAEELKLERTSASARLQSGLALHRSIQDRTERFRRVLAVDAARDEVERAHALADIYRDDTERER